MTVPTDTPSTDGAPDPEERPRFNEESLRRDIARVWGEHGAHIDLFDHMAKRAARVVPEDRPAQCPNGCADGLITVGDGDYEGAGCHEEYCPHPWHAAAHSPDEDTRREVPEVLLTFAKWADWYLEDGCRRDHHGYCQSHGLDVDCPVGPMREWLAEHGGPDAD